MKKFFDKFRNVIGYILICILTLAAIPEIIVFGLLYLIYLFVTNYIMPSKYSNEVPVE